MVIMQMGTVDPNYPDRLTLIETTLRGTPLAFQVEILSTSLHRIFNLSRFIPINVAHQLANVIEPDSRDFLLVGEVEAHRFKVLFRGF